MNDARRLAIFPLNTVLYPGGPLPLRIFETRYVDMVSRCTRDGSAFVVAAISEGNETGEASFHDVGTLATIADFQQLPDGLLGILVRGGERVRITDTQRAVDGLNTGMVKALDTELMASIPGEHAELVALLRKLLDQIPQEYYPLAQRRFDDASWVGYRLAELLPLSLTQKQYFLEMKDALRRLEVIQPLLESMQTARQS